MMRREESGCADIDDLPVGALRPPTDDYCGFSLKKQQRSL